MMTYYELIDFLESIVNSSKEDKNLNQLNSFNVSLKGDRYFRFIDQMSYVIKERLTIALDNIVNKIKIENINYDLFVIEFNDLLNEFEYCKKLINIKLIQENNRSELYTTLNSSINNILNVISGYFDNTSNEEIMKLIKKNYIKEE